MATTGPGHCGVADPSVVPGLGAAPGRAALPTVPAILSAIETVYRQKFAAFQRVAANVAGDPELSRDAVQEAFTRAIRRHADFRGDGPLEGWICRTVINAARHQPRVAKRNLPAEQMVDLLIPPPGGGRSTQKIQKASCADRSPRCPSVSGRRCFCATSSPD